MPTYPDIQLTPVLPTYNVCAMQCVHVHIRIFSSLFLFRVLSASRSQRESEPRRTGKSNGCGDVASHTHPPREPPASARKVTGAAEKSAAKNTRRRRSSPGFTRFFEPPSLFSSSSLLLPGTLPLLFFSSFFFCLIVENVRRTKRCSRGTLGTLVARPVPRSLPPRASRRASPPPARSLPVSLTRSFLRSFIRSFVPRATRFLVEFAPVKHQRRMNGAGGAEGGGPLFHPFSHSLIVPVVLARLSSSCLAFLRLPRRARLLVAGET